MNDNHQKNTEHMLLHVGYQIASSTPFDLLHHNTTWSSEAKEMCVDIIISFLSIASSLLNDYEIDVLIINKGIKIIYHKMIMVACQKQHPQL